MLSLLSWLYSRLKNILYFSRFSVEKKSASTVFLYILLFYFSYEWRIGITSIVQRRALKLLSDRHLRYKLQESRGMDLEIDWLINWFFSDWLRDRDGDIASNLVNWRPFSSQITLHGMAAYVTRHQNERCKAAYQGESKDDPEGHSSPSFFYSLTFWAAAPVEDEVL